MDRLFTVAMVAIVASTAFAGCFGGDDDEGTPPTPTPDTNNTATTPPPTTTTPPPPEEEPLPADTVESDSGAIQGQFDQSWPIEVKDPRYKSTLVQFNLTPSQAGAPITARVFVQFVSSDGTSLKSATIGLGAGTTIEWAIAPGELAAGTYTLKATAEPNDSGAPGVPSLGFANYDLFMMVAYR